MAGHTENVGQEDQSTGTGAVLSVVARVNF